jgi:hypothetical protein
MIKTEEDYKWLKNIRDNIKQTLSKIQYQEGHVAMDKVIRLYTDLINDWEEKNTPKSLIIVEGLNSIKGVTRVEVIDLHGRSYVNRNKNMKLTLSMQDDGRTLKVFIDENDCEHNWHDIDNFSDRMVCGKCGKRI